MPNGWIDKQLPAFEEGQEVAIHKKSLTITLKKVQNTKIREHSCIHVLRLKIVPPSMIHWFYNCINARQKQH